jgi:hypothetical protein
MIGTLRFLALGFAMSILGLAGCGPQSQGTMSPAGSVLTDVSDLLRSAAGPDGRGPAKVADLSRFESQFPRGYQAVKSGDVVVVWGAKMPGEGEAATAAAVVIAYEKKVPSEGGYVLLQNGTVKEMSAGEFNAAPKAK